VSSREGLDHAHDVGGARIPADGTPIRRWRSGTCERHPEGADAAFGAASRFEIDIAGDRFRAPASFRAPCDFAGVRVRA